MTETSPDRDTPDIELPPHDVEATLARWADAPPAIVKDRPRLFWAAADDAALRERALADGSFVARSRQSANTTIDDASVFADEPAWHFTQQTSIGELAAAAWLFQEPRLASLTTRLLDRAASAEKWVAPVHEPMACDHVAANIGATFATTLDLLADALTEEQLHRYGDAVAAKCLDPFLETCRERSVFWAQRDCPGNWRMMTCGDAGLAALGAPGIDEERRNEILAYALEGVVDILDTIPPDGDFVEGPHYFMATLGMGLRYLVALSRIDPDAARYLAHPRLRVVADYVLHVTEPDGGTYDYFDNSVAWSPRERATMLLLADRLRRPDLAGLGRAGGRETVLHFAWDPEGMDSRAPGIPAAAWFRTTGVVTMRSDWSEPATYAGFRCGPTAVGHSHLDSGSFVVTSRGERLLIDEGLWPYAHFLGFFGTEGPRWTFDGNATVAHNTLLIGGRGQLYGEEHAGSVTTFADHGDLGVVAVGNLSGPYSDRVSSATRTLVFLPPDTFILIDRVRSDEPCAVELLFHHRAEEITGGDLCWSVSRGGVRLHVSRLLSDAVDDPWRVTDATRTTNYEDSNTHTPAAMEIRYRSVGPITLKREHNIVHVLSVETPVVATATRHSGGLAVNAANRTVRFAESGEFVEIASSD